MTEKPPAGPVAFVGAGNMGGAMAARLCERGWQVVVCDIDPARQQAAKAAGARLAATPLAAAQALPEEGVLIVCVVDAAQCRTVLLGEGDAPGAVAGLRPGQTVMLCPTIAPEDIEALAAALLAQGIGCIDAPMSGGPQRARDGSMSLMVAAPAPVLARHAALLDALSSQVFRISERVGDGARTKLVNNLLAGINLVGAAEALALAGQLGLDLKTTLGVIERSSGQSWIGSDRLHRALNGDVAPRAHLSLLTKDTRLAVQAATAAGFAGPLGAGAARTFAEASQAGLANRDDGVLLHWLQGRGAANGEG